MTEIKMKIWTEPMKAKNQKQMKNEVQDTFITKHTLESETYQFP